jgi:exopolysaccharide biosynthesis protein
VADLSAHSIEARTTFSDDLQSPWALATAASAEVAITGTFFAPSDGTPVADVLVDGALEARGNRGSVFAVDEGGRPMIIDRPFRRKFDWTGFRHGLRGGVRLISNGKVNPNPRAQAFRDPRIWGHAARTGVGISRAGKLVLMATGQNVTLSEFGRAMRAAGAVDALSLDGGGSTCLYYHGKMVVKTGRRLSNMIVLRRTSEPASRVAAESHP